MELIPDFTIFIQLALFILFWLVFKSAVVGPMTGVLADRARRTIEAKQDAERTAAAAQSEGARYDEAVREHRLRMARETDAARHAAIEESNREIAAARTNIAYELGHRRELVATQLAAARRQLATEAEAIAGQMLGRVSGSERP